MKSPKSLFLLGFLLFIFFIFFTILTGADIFKNSDLFTTVSFQKFIPRIFDTPFSFLSLLGSAEIVLLILLILWLLYRKLNLFYVLIFFGIFHFFEIIGKILVNHPGPSYKFFRYDLPFLFPTSSFKIGSSYPSGHLGRTAFISVIFIFIIYYSKNFSSLQKKLLYCGVVFIGLLMFVSRIYLGEHWLSDVLGGSILGSSLALFMLGFM